MILFALQIVIDHLELEFHLLQAVKIVVLLLFELLQFEVVPLLLEAQ